MKVPPERRGGWAVQRQRSEVKVVLEPPLCRCPISQGWAGGRQSPMPALHLSRVVQPSRRGQAAPNRRLAVVPRPGTTATPQGRERFEARPARSALFLG